MHRYLRKEKVRVSVHLYRQMQLCGYTVVAVTPAPPDFTRFAKPGEDIEDIRLLHQAWAVIRGGISGDEEKKAAWKAIFQLGERIFPTPEMLIRPAGDPPCDMGLFRFRSADKRGRFFVLLHGNESLGISPFDMFLLVSFWQVEQGFLPFHAAGLIHRNELFLFTGVSGAGKSTLARLSRKRGCTILDDDQVLLYQIPGKGWSGDAWRREQMHLDSPLRAVFSIVQSKENRLERLSRPRTARLMLERHYDIMGRVYIDGDYLNALRISADIARNIPGYELHFRKSPDFWDLIDAEMGE